MKRNVTIILFLYLSISNSFAKKIEGILITKKDSTVKVLLDIPILIIPQEIAFFRIQSSIVCYSLTNSKKYVIHPNQVKEIRFKYDSEEIRMVSCIDSSEIITSDRFLFLRLIVDGKLKLYKYYTLQSNDLSAGYYLQKNNDKLYRPRLFYFKKDMNEYLNGCVSLIRKINDNVYSKSDLEYIVKDYNSCSN